MTRAKPAVGQLRIFIESLNEAVKQTVLALGTYQEVAAMIWPAKAVKDPIAAGRYLADCLNPDRAAKLDGDEILLVAKMGRTKGVHLIAAHINETLDYAPPVPVEPADRLAQLEQDFIDRADALIEMSQHIKRSRGSRASG